MRLAPICAAICLTVPIAASADDTWKEGYAPGETAFAYSAGHIDEAAALEEASLTTRFYPPMFVNGLAAEERPRLFSKTELCSTAVLVAEENRIPVPFFINLIHQESGFKPHVVSPAGAQGIAQFMPGVAASRGLANPFDPIAALTASGKFLAHLVSQFGNFGLAAAAYNAGSKRVQSPSGKFGFMTKRLRPAV
jgi:soluble lytic murein transglycosylase-like protein